MENFSELPVKIQRHLEELLKTSGLPVNDESLSKLASIWITKEFMFDSQVKALDMIETGSFSPDSPDGAVLYTYSGSLITLSPSTDGSRTIEYYSIRLRQDVPGIVIIKDTNITQAVSPDSSAFFTKGPIQKTSAVFKIMTFDKDISPEEEDRRIRQATIFLTNAFVKINRTVILNDKQVPREFNTKFIARFLAAKNGITIKKTRSMLEDYQYMIETGILLGEKVRFGKLGTLTLRAREARKAHIGINPKTGQKLTIDAKPPMMVPKMIFGRSLKEKAATIVLKKG